MKNAEKYKDEIFAQLCESGNFALIKKTNRLCDCFDCKCNDCLFSSFGSCSDGRLNWLNSEYKEPKVFTDDEKALVRLLPKLKWVAKDKDGSVFGYDIKPEKAGYAWYSNHNCCNLSSLSNCAFLAVKWDDTEPTSRDEILLSHCKDGVRL